MENNNTVNNNTKNDPMQISCKGCGGTMRFFPTNQSLKCMYCEKEEALDITPIDIESYSYDEWKDVTNDEQQVEEGQNIPEVKCSQCGAITTFPNNISSMKCPFCNTSLALKDKQINRFWKPNALLPFKIEEKQCKPAFDKWISNKWFAPSQLKNSTKETSAFKGIYIPHWAYDAQSHTFYSGKRGENYSTTVERNGKNVKETSTKWINVYGNVSLNFNNILVISTDSLPSNVRNILRHWDLENCVAYSNNFTSGFLTEIYKNDFRESIGEAKNFMKDEIENEIRADIGGDKQK
jgi:hypothetical protein